MTIQRMRQVFDKYVIRHGDDECWEWSKSHQRSGYPQATIGGTTMTVHRISYELHYGPIPPGMCVCHTCDNKGCINPAHLWLGTRGENARDRDSKDRVRYGSTHPVAILTEADVTRIRELASQGMREDELADTYNLRPRSLKKVITGQTWARVEGALDSLPDRRHKFSGQGNPSAKLTANQVRAIRELSQDGWSRQEIATLYNITSTTVRYIVLRKSWKNIE